MSYSIMFKNHIKEHCPRMYERLTKNGKLQGEAERRARKARRMIAELSGQGDMDRLLAISLAEREWICIPGEKE